MVVQSNGLTVAELVINNPNLFSRAFGYQRLIPLIFVAS